MKKYGSATPWRYFNDAFDYLPIAAIIEGNLKLIQEHFSVFMVGYHLKSILLISCDLFKEMFKFLPVGRFVI